MEDKLRIYFYRVDSLYDYKDEECCGFTMASSYSQAAAIIERYYGEELVCIKYLSAGPDDSTIIELDKETLERIEDSFVW